MPVQPITYKQLFKISSVALFSCGKPTPLNCRIPSRLTGKPKWKLKNFQEFNSLRIQWKSNEADYQLSHACIHIHIGNDIIGLSRPENNQSSLELSSVGSGSFLCCILWKKSFVRCRKKNMTILIGCGLVKTKSQTTRSSYAKLPRLNFKPPNDSVKIMRTQFIRRLFCRYFVFVFVSIAVDKTRDYR